MLESLFIPSRASPRRTVTILNILIGGQACRVRYALGKITSVGARAVQEDGASEGEETYMAAKLEGRQHPRSRSRLPHFTTSQKVLVTGVPRHLTTTLRHNLLGRRTSILDAGT